MLNEFKRARLVKGIRQYELAEKLGVSYVTVCKWENGKGFPDVKRLRQVADELGTTVDKLLDGRGA